MPHYPIYLGLGALAFGFPAAIATSSAPEIQTDLICPTTNHEECYPRLFEPTENFQVIKDGQELPPGLHVRMDVYSGKKEARLNIPTAEDLALEASASQDVLVVPQQENDASNEEGVKVERPALRDKYGKSPPAYEMAGKILPPRPDDGSGDAASFSSALNILKDFKENFASKNVDEDLDPALDVLFDLSNDIYYGVEITKDPEVLLTLFALMHSRDENPGAIIRDLVFNFKGFKGNTVPNGQDSPQSALRRRQAAGVLAHAIQNNPTALSELSGQGWMEHLCVLIEGETDPAPMKSKIKALSHMLNDPKLRQDFMNSSGLKSQSDDSFTNGTQVLLSIFLRKGSNWNGVKTQITELLLDNYVDTEMGAQLGLWPIEDAAGDAKHCTNSGHELEDKCWEYHLEKTRPELAGKEEEFPILDKLLAALKFGREARRANGHGEL